MPDAAGQTASGPGALPAIVSIHDVMPETMPQVGALLTLLQAHRLGPVDLLVVPGLDWSDAQIATLAQWQRAGHRLAGHGWRHRADRMTGIGHRLHGLVLSRNVAEHLALDADGIAALVTRCHGWFAAHDLPAPALYVPPAWAMGALPRHRLRTLPFRRYEVFSGLIEAETGRRRLLPVVGFEADTAGRAVALGVWNALNVGHARAWGTPLRVAIHPFDLSYRLAADLRRLLPRLVPVSAVP